QRRRRAWRRLKLPDAAAGTEGQHTESHPMAQPVLLRGIPGQGHEAEGAGMTRSGSEYTRALKDGRAVFLDGGRVDDVTSHPAFAEGVRSIARLYDIAHDPANRELMTFPSP